MADARLRVGTGSFRLSALPRRPKTDVDGDDDITVVEVRAPWRRKYRDGVRSGGAEEVSGKLCVYKREGGGRERKRRGDLHKMKVGPKAAGGGVEPLQDGLGDWEWRGDQFNNPWDADGNRKRS
jgi:hypothetical protein